MLPGFRKVKSTALRGMCEGNVQVAGVDNRILGREVRVARSAGSGKKSLGLNVSKS